MIKGSNSTREMPQIPMMILFSGVFLTSLSQFIYQVMLTRVFSTLFRYHYVFLITSLAILGLGIGGILVYELRKMIAAEKAPQILPGIQMALTAAYLICFILVYKLPFVNFLPLYAGIMSFPFILGGIYLSWSFQMIPEGSHKLYFADLIGAGLGSIGVVFLLNHFGLVNTVLTVSILTAIAGLLQYLFVSKGKKVTASIMVVLILLGGYTQQGWIKNFQDHFTGYFTSPNNSLLSMEEDGIDYKLVYSTWDAYSRTDVIKLPDDQRRIVTIDGSSNAQMVRFDGDEKEVPSLKKEVNYLAFTTGANDNVLLIGSGGGKDVVDALLGGGRQIDAVEINQGSVEAARELKDYNGNIYGRKGVNVFVQDGRNFVRTTDKKYDVIYLAQVMSAATDTVAYALSENFIYTKDAVRDYFGHLNENGRIAFVLHDKEDLTRILLTTIEVLTERGVPYKDLSKYFYLVNSVMPGHAQMNEIHIPLLVVKKTPFRKEEAESFVKNVKNSGQMLLHAPYIFEQVPLTTIAKEGANYVNKVYQESSVNLVPTTDNRPFFYDYKKGLDKILLTLLIVVFAMGFILFAPVAVRPGMLKPSLYFLGLGIGFMLLELPVIQLLSFILGHPIRAFTTALVALLTGGGVGSLIGEREWFTTRKGKYWPLAAVAVMSVITYLVLYLLGHKVLIASLTIRTVLSFLVVFFLGLFMGMPFPRGMKQLKASGLENYIPFMWGINGLMSVGGSVLATVIAMKAGLSYTIFSGGLVYLILLIGSSWSNSIDAQ